MFWKIGVYFYMQKSAERGRFVFWRMIIRPPFTFEWRDRGVIEVAAFKNSAVNVILSYHVL